MSELTGTGTLVHLILRRDRVRIAAWVLCIVVAVIVIGAAVDSLYPTEAELAEAAAMVEDNPAVIAFNGPSQGLDTLGGRIAFEGGSPLLVLIGLMSLLMVGRHTRADEESGRTELLRALPVGRYAQPAASLIVVAGMSLLVGALAGVSILTFGVPAIGALALGASFTVFGLILAGVTLVAAQITENTRVVYGVSGAVLGVAYAVRALGDMGDGTLSWLSPIGLVQKSRPFADERWWPLALGLVITAALTLAAKALADHRDVAGSLVPSRPGPPVGARTLGTPLGLALRLQRGGLIAWSVSLCLGSAAYGLFGDEVDDFFEDESGPVVDWLGDGAGISADSYLTNLLLLLAIVGSVYAVQSAQRMRSEESAQRAEPLLATPLSRFKWMASHLVMAFAGSVIVLAVTGLGAGATYGAAVGDASEVPRLLGAALAYTPAVWLLVGFTTALFGVLPRALVTAWVLLSACFVIGMFGEMLELPTWSTNVSPFEHVPELPAAGFDPVPLVLLAALAVGSTAFGIVGFYRRDVGTT